MKVALGDGTIGVSAQTGKTLTTAELEVRKARVETFGVENFSLEWWNDLSDLLPNIKFWGIKRLFVLCLFSLQRLHFKIFFKTNWKFLFVKARSAGSCGEKSLQEAVCRRFKGGERPGIAWKTLNCLIVSSVRSSSPPVVLVSKMLNPTKRQCKNTKRTSNYSILRSPCSRNKPR